MLPSHIVGYSVLNMFLSSQMNRIYHIIHGQSVSVILFTYMPTFPQLPEIVSQQILWHYCKWVQQ